MYVGVKFSGVEICFGVEFCFYCVYIYWVFDDVKVVWYFMFFRVDRYKENFVIFVFF